MSIEYSAFLNVSIIVFCLCVGFILKDTIKWVDNRTIPPILMIIGGIASCIYFKGVSIEILTIGMVSGLASTGLHQTVKQKLKALGFFLNEENENNENY